MTRLTVIGGPSSEDLAKKISYRLKAKYIKTDLRIFPDGESKLTLSRKLSKGKSIVVQSTYPPVDSHIIQILFLISKARKYSKDVTVVIPYIGYARQDKAFLQGEIVSTSVIASLLEMVGATRIITMDNHSKISLRYFKIPVKNISAISLLVTHFKKLNLKNPLVVSPDLFWSSQAREFAKQLGAKHIALSKHRNRKKGNVKIKFTNPKVVKDHDIILVDDMISSGETMIKATKFLKKYDCGKIFASCTHGVLVNNARKKLKRIGIADIVSTNTIPGPDSIIDISELIASTILENQQ